MNNIKNKLISKKTIENIINKYIPNNPIHINNIKKFQKAFVHKSFCFIDNENSDSDNYSSIQFDPELTSSNERLEFLGDKVIDLITTEFLFDKFPDKDEGFLTKLKSRLVKKESLAYLGEKLNFKKFILISSHVERIRGRDNPRLLEDLFESFMGILYKDQRSNLNICKQFLLGIYNEFIDLDKIINNNDNYKDILLRYFHSKGWNHPIYKNIYYIGNDNLRQFTVIVLIDNKYNFKQSNSKTYKLLKIIHDDSVSSLKYTVYENIYNEIKSLMDTNVLIGLGKGSTKKIAEQNCSKECILNLNIPLNY